MSAEGYEHRIPTAAPPTGDALEPVVPAAPEGGFEMSITPLPKRESVKPASFEVQWRKPERVVFTGQTVVDLYDIRPEREEDEVPVALAPGWGGTPEMYRENARTLVEQGRRVLAMDAPHGVSLREDERVTAEANGIPETGMRRIASFVQSLDAKGIGRVDAVAHSQGCLDMVLAATLYPEKFRSMVLVNPAGMIGKDSFWRLATGFSRDVVKGYADQIRKAIAGGRQLNSGKEVTLEPMLRAIRSVHGSIAMDPIMAFREVLAISDAQIHELLAGLMAKGVRIAVMQADEDGAFPAERMEQVIPVDVQKTKFAGDHSSFQIDAEALTAAAARLLAEMAADERSPVAGPESRSDSAA